MLNNEESQLEQRRINTKSSRTAAYNCFSRACATREKEPCFRGPDTLAVKLLPPIPRLILEFSLLRKLMVRMMFPPGIYEYVCARTKLIDKVFLEAVYNRFPQIVLFGAGFDTRALRFAEHIQGTKIIELDIPTTQEPKLDIYKKKRLNVPDVLRFASIDFERDDLFQVLSGAGYQDRQLTLFIWEGVCMYLDDQAVDDTLTFIQKHSASGSQIIFDYIYASVLRRENRYYGEEGIYNTVAKAGESWKFGIEDGKIEQFLEKRGFKMLVHYTAFDLEQLYQTAGDGTLHGRVNGTHGIARAVVI